MDDDFPEASRTAEIPYQTIYESLRKMREARPSAKALYYYGSSASYDQLLQKVDELAAAYYALGVRPGDTIILDDDVPLADVPKTGDPLTVLAAISALSGAGLFLTRKKREDEE